MYIYIYVIRIYLYMCACARMYECMCVRARVHVCVCAYMRVCTYACACVYMHKACSMIRIRISTKSVARFLFCQRTCVQSVDKHPPQMVHGSFKCGMPHSLITCLIHHVWNASKPRCLLRVAQFAHNCDARRIHRCYTTDSYVSDNTAPPYISNDTAPLTEFTSRVFYRI